LAELGIDLVDMEFSCCGYPMSHLYYQSSLLASARGLAMAEAQGLDLLTPCKCCFGQFKRAMHALGQEPERRRLVERELAKEGLAYPEKSQAKHLLSVLYHDLGLETLRKRVVRPYQHLNVAVLYGCHALRPSKVTGFDHPWGPTIIDKLVEVTGAVSVPWAGKLSCCGSPLREHNPELSLALIRQRLSECRDAKADVLCISCPYSQMQAERAYAEPRPSGDQELISGAVLYPQLLGLAMGLTPEDLTLVLNTPDASYLRSFLAS
jgi:heterodisulfide reductase subunit B